MPPSVRAWPERELEEQIVEVRGPYLVAKRGKRAREVAQLLGAERHVPRAEDGDRFAEAMPLEPRDEV
jgi:hypothetical protein